MTHELNTPLNFGKYKGLTIQEVYQGTLKIDKYLLRDYLNHILNAAYFLEWAFFDASTLIVNFDLSDDLVRVIGDIDDPDLPEGPNNRIRLGNLEKGLQTYINQHFNPTSLGVLTDFAQFNDSQKTPLQIGGDPQYLDWCRKKVGGFKLSPNCERQLKKLSYARLVGINILYVGNETYEYGPIFKIVKPY